jgi:hypothetical protein
MSVHLRVELIVVASIRSGNHGTGASHTTTAQLSTISRGVGRHLLSLFLFIMNLPGGRVLVHSIIHAEPLILNVAIVSCTNDQSKHRLCSAEAKTLPSPELLQYKIVPTQAFTGQDTS